MLDPKMRDWLVAHVASPVIAGTLGTINLNNVILRTDQNASFSVGEIVIDL